MQATIKKWGNSAAIRIPGPVLGAARAQLNQTVDVREEGGCIIIEPRHADPYSIEALVAGITDENRHDVMEMGEPVGQEVW